MLDHIVDPDAYTKAAVITKSYYRDVYPRIDPTRAELAQEGKVVIVTGAGRGLGIAIAEAQAKTNVRGLVLVGRSLTHLEKVKKEIEAGNSLVEVLAVSTDISDEVSVENLFAKVKEQFGTADTLIHNAGVITEGNDVIDKVSTSVWWNDFTVNVKGTFLINSAFLNLVKQSSVSTKTVINLSSNVAIAPPTLSSYFSTKAAVMKFTEILQAENPELAAYTLNPGIVLTDMTAPGFVPYAKDTPALVGAVAAYLSAERPEHLKGRNVNVNWDLVELEGRKDEIMGSNKLKLGINT